MLFSYYCYYVSLLIKLFEISFTFLYISLRIFTYKRIIFYVLKFIHISMKIFSLKMCVLYVLVIISICSCNEAFSYQFKQIDYLRMLQNHPKMADYDHNTGRFNNTKSQQMTIEEIDKRIQSLQDKIQESKDMQSKLANNPNVIFDINEKDSSWQKIGELDKQIEDYKNLIVQLYELKENSGVPSKTEIFAVIDTMIKDITASYTQGVSSNTIILNKYPLYYRGVEPPLIANFEEGYLHFFKSKNEDSLIDYISYSPYIGLYFPITENSVLYLRESESHDE